MRTYGLVSSLLFLSALGAGDAAANRLVKASVKEARINGAQDGGIDTRRFHGAVGRVSFKTAAWNGGDAIRSRMVQLGAQGVDVQAHGKTYHQKVDVTSRRRLRGGIVIKMKVRGRDYELPQVATSAVEQLVERASSIVVDGEHYAAGNQR